MSHWGFIKNVPQAEAQPDSQRSQVLIKRPVWAAARALHLWVSVSNAISSVHSLLAVIRSKISFTKSASGRAAHFLPVLLWSSCNMLHTPKSRWYFSYFNRIHKNNQKIQIHVAVISLWGAQSNSTRRGTLSQCLFQYLKLPLDPGRREDEVTCWSSANIYKALHRAGDAATEPHDSV